MKREVVMDVCQREALDTAARLFGTTKDDLKSYASYEGCQNLVFDYGPGDRPLILRISYRPDRSVDHIRAELHFVNYLADHGVRVARAVPSVNGNLLEVIEAGGILFVAVSFVQGKGMRVPDNGYRYREGAPLEEYCRNWGRMLGQMHALAKDYQPVSSLIRRPEWFELGRFGDIEGRVPSRLSVVRDKLSRLLAQLRALPTDRQVYGLIHGDFNDGNFTVDYDNGDLTVFDFDDACYCWFMYELACAWEGGVGRTMFESLAKRKAYMAHYFQEVLEGYCRENDLSVEWLERLPLFLKAIEMEEFLHYVQYIDSPDPETRAALNYKIRCIENDIPFLGFFDSVYSPAAPFSL